MPPRFHGVFGSLLAGKVPLTEEEQGKEVVAAEEGAQQAGQLALDIYEADGYYIIKAPIAGVRLSDLDIDISGSTITIRGKRDRGEEIPEDQYYLQECFWGDFSRSVTLPCAINPSRVRATFSKDSILKVYVPKEGKVKIVKISEGS